MKYTAIFRWGLGFYAWGGFLLEELSLGRKISGGGFSREIFILGGFDRIPLRNFINCLTVSLPTQFCMWRCTEGKIRGIFSVWFDFQKKKSTEGGISGVIETTITE
jgi:hypothetical protein